MRSDWAQVTVPGGGGGWAQTRQADSEAPASCPPPRRTSQRSPWGLWGLTSPPPTHVQKPPNSPVRRSDEGISFLQSFQILGRHTKVSCKTKISDKVFHGHSSTHSPGAWTRRHPFHVNDQMPSSVSQTSGH